MKSNGRTTWPLVDCCTSNRRGQVDLQFDIQQSTNGALQSSNTAHSGTYWHIMPNSGTVQFLTGNSPRGDDASYCRALLASCLAIMTFDISLQIQPSIIPYLLVRWHAST
jgi:hypothetical protein